MKFGKFSVPRALGLGGALITGILISGCGGAGGASSALPTTPTAIGGAPTAGAMGAETNLASITVDRAAAPAVMGNVTDAVARYMPFDGGKIAPMPGHPPGGLMPNRGSYHPKDLHNYGGPTMQYAASYNIYVNCASSCWGNPATFETNLAGSSFAHLLDQYTGSTANNRYTYGGSIAESYNTSGTLQDQDIYNLVYAAAKTYGTGYAKVYHVFLASGVRQCSTSAGGCYAQQYCAYHGAVTFGDIGHTAYSVEGYQGISGCNAPDNKLTDDTVSTLSHELFETITDIDVQTNLAWYNNTYGEIGDICRSNYGNVSVGGTSYNIQQEYSNKYHACSYSP